MPAKNCSSGFKRSSMRGSIVGILLLASVLPCSLRAQSYASDSTRSGPTLSEYEALLEAAEYQMDRADSLQARLDFSRAVDDSNTLEMAMLQVENEGLRQNQRKWYDELVIMVKVLAFALAAKWLGDG